jgi:hypothetical protein
MSRPALVQYPRDYVPPRKLTTQKVKLLKETKYGLVEPNILAGLIVEEDMLGIEESLRYADHDLADMKIFQTWIWTST